MQRKADRPKRIVAIRYTPSEPSIEGGVRLYANGWPVLAFLAVLAIAAAGIRQSNFLPPEDVLTASFSLCDSGVRQNCVVDGDTFWLNGDKVRISDIDTPELSPPRCEKEKQLGLQAKHQLLALLNAGAFELAAESGRDRDRYGRKLRTVKRDGQSIGDILVSQGLARPWDGARRSWCD